jgi:hypothetical protein
MSLLTEENLEKVLIDLCDTLCVISVNLIPKKYI